MTHEQALGLLALPNITHAQAFEILKQVSCSMLSEDTVTQGRELALRCLNRTELFGDDLAPILRDLLEALGYYPYVNQFQFPSTRTAINLEYHRSEGLPDYIFHSEQFRISNYLLNGESVILSAPTSFGKSLLIEELVASNRFTNIAIVQPTLALIDETRLKLKKYEDRYKLIFATDQTFAERNLLLMTAERIVEVPQLPTIDFFVIDEFYKLSPDRDDERANTLNHAFYRLLQHTRRFFLLGPRIASIPPAFDREYECKFVVSKYETVVTDYVPVETQTKDGFPELVSLLRDLQEPTLIYCQSPAKAEEYATRFLGEMGELADTDAHDDVISWIGSNLHPGWSLTRCLKKGIAYHHGSLPRHLAKYVVQAFNERTIRYLFCTATLIEGVNTAAKNVVVYDGNKGTRKLDFFDFSNIAGRAGRMGQHIIGRVFLFKDRPPEGTLDVDFPWYTQDKADPEILVQLERKDLHPDSLQKVERYYNHWLLDLETIRQNSTISPEGQIRLAEHLWAHRQAIHNDLHWTQWPTNAQVKHACDLIWIYLAGIRGRYYGASSGPSLARIINRYRAYKSPKDLVQLILQEPGKTPDSAIQECTGQIRVWCEFKFPKLLRALDIIQRTVFTRAGMEPGNYQFFATQIENGFVSEHLAALQEFGIPIQVASKLEPYFRHVTSLDDVLQRLKRLNLEQLGLDAYERRLLSQL